MYIVHIIKTLEASATPQDGEVLESRAGPAKIRNMGVKIIGVNCSGKKFKNNNVKTRRKMSKKIK